MTTFIIPARVASFGNVPQNKFVIIFSSIYYKTKKSTFGLVGQIQKIILVIIKYQRNLYLINLQNTLSLPKSEIFRKILLRQRSNFVNNNRESMRREF